MMLEIYLEKRITCMQYDFDHFPNRYHTNSVKWDAYPEGVLPLWVADTDFVVCPKIIDALNKRIAHPIFGYSHDSQEFKEVVRQRMKDRYNWEISINSICFVPGIVSGFNYAIRAFCGSQDSVIYQTPAYPPFIHAPQNFNIEGIQNDLFFDQADRRYHIDFERFEAQIQPNTSLFILCNPHNPVGRVFTREELIRLGEICERHNLVICSDEIHNEIIYSGYHQTPIASISKELSRRTITFIAPSKTFNIAGLSCSVAIIENPEMREKYQRALKDLCSGVIGLSQEAGLAAYRDCDDWLQQANRYLQGNRDFLLQTLAEKMPQIGTNQIEATFLAWLDCSRCGIDGSPSAFFEKQAKVGLNDGAEFGSRYAHFARLNFGTNRALLTEALDRMAESLQKV